MQRHDVKFQSFVNNMQVNPVSYNYVQVCMLYLFIFFFSLRTNKLSLWNFLSSVLRKPLWTFWDFLCTYCLTQIFAACNMTRYLLQFAGSRAKGAI